MTTTTNIEQQARELLATLGLAFRIEDSQRIDADTWRELARLAHRVIECATFQEPARTGPVYLWLRIDKLRGNPNRNGYIVRSETPPQVYWIPKNELLRLHELEDLLTDLAMSDVENIVLERLKRIQAELSEMREQKVEIIGRLANIESGPRRRAIEQAIANNALSGFHPSEFGYTVFRRWIDGHWTTDEAVALVIQHYRDNPCPDSDQVAQENRMGLTDSRQLRTAEADITTLRMADLEVDPV